ncbi:MAG: tRNA 2-thiouridine(34) synthase MnmA [Pseudomonadota bacterium]
MSGKGRVIVGLSGGVDSSVAALRLLEQGYEVEGLFMKNWEEDDTEEHCPAKQDMLDALAVCETLGIEFHWVNFAREYWDRVFAHFLEEYRAGRTPNPDILCNREIKFRAFLDHALNLGADYIATGHYARVRHDETGAHLLKGLDANKDQSYFLHALGQAPLSRALFPIGELEKPLVRELARKAGFKTASKKDSTGICFIGERRFTHFLNTYLPARPGDIETPEGQLIGHHNGLMFHTIGQRQGLGIGGLKGFSEAPWFVADKDLARNVLIAVQGDEHPLLYKRALLASQPHWIAGTPPAVLDTQTGMACQAKIRYRQPDQPCQVRTGPDGRLQVSFDTPQRAVTPGQSVVFYRDDECLGGAIIETALDPKSA